MMSGKISLMIWHPKTGFAAALLLTLGQAVSLGKEPPSESNSKLFDYWSLKPIVKHTPPALGQTDRNWARNPIDHFIAARLAEKHLTHSVEADRRTLIRRIYFDLHGLPPTQDEVRTFVANPDPSAYEKLVEKLQSILIRL